MGKFDGILLATDLDGTVLRKDKSVSEENLKAIEYFKAQGGRFTVITGRMPYTSDKICEILKPNAPIGCVNGGGVYDIQKKEYVWIAEIDPTAIELAEYARERIEGLGYQVNTPGKIYFCSENEAMKWFRNITGTPFIFRKPSEIQPPMMKVLFGDLEESKLDYLAELLKLHPKAEMFDFIRSEKMLYEILPKGINKGVALMKIAEHLGIDPARTVAVGDYNNDIGMVKAAGLGIAVENAVPELKAVADVITVNHENDALAKIIYAIESGEYKFKK